MMKLHETHKRLITMYVTTLMNAAPVYADREKTIKVWLNTFSYIQTTKQYFDFEKACKQIINNNETLDKMPLPGKILQMIRDENRVNDKPINLNQGRPRPEFMKLVHEFRVILKKAKKVKEDDENSFKKLMDDYWVIVKRMCFMSGEPFRR